MRGAGQIGFSQRIQLSWMERTANLALAGMDRKEVTASLQEILQEKLSVGGTAQRGNREKAISILLRIWLTGCPQWPFIRDKGLELIRELPERQHLPIHWGMAMAVYPFFGAVAEATGRLLQLQETISSAQVQRRLRERYGERETVFRAARRVLRVFADWGVLEDTPTKGIYRLKEEKRFINSEAVSLWMVVARLAAGEGKPESIRTLTQHPSLFPFQIGMPSQKVLEAWDGINVIHHGFDEKMMVSLQS
ncbi:MAG: hypothetical protein HQL52_19170 [Magnetococcales bacterium]|nr:hypothetical protein [Magnetococcales bacterium]